jgi:hypothetical protein
MELFMVDEIKRTYNKKTRIEIERYPKEMRREERRFRPRTQRAWEKFVKRLREDTLTEELENALANKSMGKIMEIFSDEKLEKLSRPLQGILKDATIKGGKVGQVRLNKGEFS